jgi:type VI secretion system protein ImpC
MSTQPAEKNAFKFDLNDPENPVIDQVLFHSKIDMNSSQTPFFREMVQTFAKEFLDGNIIDTGNLSKDIGVRIDEIDRILTAQINEIIHHSEFQALEASWLSVHQLVKTVQPDENVKVRLLDTTKEEILEDAQSAADFEDSALFKILYEQEYGTFGGQPYGLMIGDFEFSNNACDIECLKSISHVACAAHAPFIASVGCDLFGLETFKDLEKPRSLEKIFESSDYAAWNAFRSTEEAQYVTLTFPCVMKREPYEKEHIKEFNFREDMGSYEDNKFVWGSPAYLLAQKIILSYKDYGWFQNIRGYENGGLVSGLPQCLYTDKKTGLKIMKPPVEVSISNRREIELENLGFLPLIYKKNSDLAVFIGSKTVHKVKQYLNPITNANAELITHLSYLLSLSRFAHYLKCITREKIGSFSSRQELNKWISQYVIANDHAKKQIKSIRPLRAARIDVVEVIGRPGVYKAVAYLRPHYYLNELTISLRLVSNLNLK